MLPRAVLATYGAIFVVGFLVGYLSASMLRSVAPEEAKGQLQIAVAVLVTSTWFLSILAELAIESYTTSIATHALMGAVAGFLFGTGTNALDAVLGKK